MNTRDRVSDRKALSIVDAWKIVCMINDELHNDPLYGEHLGQNLSDSNAPSTVDTRHRVSIIKRP